MIRTKVTNYQHRILANLLYEDQRTHAHCPSIVAKHLAESTQKVSRSMSILASLNLLFRHPRHCEICHSTQYSLTRTARAFPAKSDET